MNVQPWHDSEEQIVGGLRKLCTEGGSGNFMIVSSGDVYVQFAGRHGDTRIECQTVGNAYLPTKRKLTMDKIHELQRLGFVLDEEPANFSKTFELSDEQKARELATLALTILEYVYGCRRDSKLDIQLTLE